ncbi:MAG: hypothetical protein AB7U85_07835 [Alphaproteobacteria bacterium]
MGRGLRYSLILHAAVFALFRYDFFGFVQHQIAPSTAPLIVDLSKVKISEFTNLPPKAEKKKENVSKETEKKEPPKEEKKAEKKAEPKFVPPKKPDPKPEVKKEQPKIDDKAAKLEEVEAKKEDKKTEPKKIAEKKVAPTPPKPKTTPKKETKKEPEPSLKSLLASVEKIEKSIQERPQDEKEPDETEDEGIEGGSGGFLGRELTISDKDALAAKIRQCWNFDAGSKGVEDMVIEIRAYLNQDGSVRDVAILDMSRYNNDGFYRSIAESARRAVFICSPFSMLPERYPDKFDDWKTLFLRFNPMNGGVF